MAGRRWAEKFAGGIVSTALARLNARHPWSHNDHFHGWVLANLPERRGTALDVGCGRGELLAALAPHFTTVHGNDADAAMRHQAAARCAGLANVTISDQDWTTAAGPYDLVTMIAVLHHLELVAALHQVKRILAPGGRFLVVGLAPPRSAIDHVWDLASIVTNPLIGYVKHPWPVHRAAQSPPFPVQDPTVPFAELRERVTDVLPGAVLRHRLAFRHTIAWTKPSGADT